MISAAWDWYYGSQDEELLAECQFEEPYFKKGSNNDEVCVRPATLSDGLQVTIFTQVKSRPKEETRLEKSSKRLKVLRHPNILRHVGIVVTETEVNLVTERVSPLRLQFETVDANEVSSGMYDIAQALKFIHEKANLTHNCVSLDSIYVTEGGSWKLANFECACDFSEATAPFLKGLTRLKDIIPPEESDNMVAFPIENKNAHCRDVYALGILLGMFYDQTRFASGVKSQELQDLLEEILQKDYRERPTVAELLETAAWSSDYIEIVNFLQSITLKGANDKETFFTGLIPKLKSACISDELIAKRIARLLLSPVVLAEDRAVAKIIPRLLTPVPMRAHTRSKGLISSGMFARYVIPHIVDMLAIKILHVRLVLVANFHRFVHMFEKSVLQDFVLPEILLGLHDSNNQLVSASLHALADSVPVVGGDLIVGSEREKLFGFGMPKFDGAILVETSSLAHEMKPKRKPKKPAKKLPKKPVTLLELAMKKRKNASNASPSREVMLLKQNELASTLHSEPNGLVNYITIEDPNPHAEDENMQTPILPVQVNGNRETSTPQPKSNPQPQLCSDIDATLDAPKVILEPEIETWASSGSEDDWGAFEALENESQSDRSKNRIGNRESKFPRKSSKTDKASKAVMKNVPTKSNIEDNGVSVNTITEKSHLEQDLGCEFEIAVKTKPPRTINEEPDFFADMAPEIESRTAAVNPANSLTESTGTVTSTLSSPVSMSLVATESGDDEGSDGWDNDDITWDE